MEMKKSQGALELISILVFVFILIGVVMYIIGLYSLQVQQNSITKNRDDFAQSLIAEVNLLQKVKGGYTRSIEIPKAILENYNVSINEPYLIITDIISGTNETYFYEYPTASNTQISILKRDLNFDGENETYFYLFKSFNETFEGLNLVKISQECIGSNVICAHNFILRYDLLSSVCPLNYVKLFSIANDDDHVLYNTQTDPSFTSVCLHHKIYTLNNSVGASNELLFYLSELNATHIFTNKTSIFQPSLNWYETRLYTSGGTLDYQINVSDMSSTHLCLGSIDEDNVIGSHYNRVCGGGRKGLWLSLT